MSEITPEIWSELDELERVCRQPVPSWKGDQDEEWMQDCAQRARLARLVGEYLRPLIDAARPKCETCRGAGVVQAPYTVLRRPIECPDCDCTGWAR